MFQLQLIGYCMNRPHLCNPDALSWTDKNILNWFNIIFAKVKFMEPCIYFICLHTYTYILNMYKWMYYENGEVLRSNISTNFRSASLNGFILNLALLKIIWVEFLPISSPCGGLLTLGTYPNPFPNSVGQI